MSAPRAFIDWDAFKRLPKGEPEERRWLDVVATNARLAPYHTTPCCVLVGGFRVPVDATPPQYERLRNEAAKRFIAAKAREGWELRSRIKVRPSRYAALTPAENPEDAHVQPGQKFYEIRAMFEQTRPKRLRIDVADIAKPKDAY